MNHVLICGAAGFTNRGDDALLWGMLRQLQEVAGGRPMQVVGGPELPALVAPWGATALSYDDRPNLARAIEDADLVLLGGGGMLYDVDYDATLARFLTDPSDRQWLYELAKLAAAARAAGRPVMLYAMGAGPLFSDQARKVARFLGESAQALTVRDQASADLLVECGLSPARVQLAADPAVTLEPGPEEAVQRWLEAQGLAAAPRPWIGLNLRPWYRFMGVETADGKMARLRDAVGEAIRALRARLGGTVILLPFQKLYDDDAEVLSRALAVSGLTEGALLADTPTMPDVLVGLLGRLDLMLGMRMHSLLLSLAAGTPFVGLPYSPKVNELIAAAGMADYAHPVDDLDPQAVVASCEKLLSGRSEVRPRLLQGRERLRALAAISQDLAQTLLDTARGTAPRPRPAVATRPTAEIRVLMQVRPDYREKPGGDIVQLEELLPYLREMGVTAELTGEENPDLSGWDLVHTINLDRPEEPYRHCLNALAQGKPIVLSPVHTDMSEFLEWGDPDYWLLPEPGQGDPEPRPAPPQDPIELRRRALRHLQRQAIVDWATVYLPNAQVDAEYLHRTFGMDLSRTVVVPHGIAPTFAEASPEPFLARYHLRDFVVCGAARVETRKNQLLLAAALRGTGIPLVIIGQPNPAAYLELCRRYADENALFLPAMSPQELASIFAAAKVHALVSWYEIPGLVSLEAGVAGCNIVSTDRGSPPEYLQDMAWYCDPRSIDSIRQAVRAAYDAPRSERLKQHVLANYTWRRAAERTREGYQLALDLHAARSHRDQQEKAAAALKRHCDWLERLAADRLYEVQRYQQMYFEVDGLLRQAAARAEDTAEQLRLQDESLRQCREELARITARRLYRWTEALARGGWGILRRLGMR